MNKIQILDDLTVQQIAAGEVIERPASIVKELIENSIDAKSENITIEIKNGGKTYIRVTDDGDGIGEKDLNIAFKRHSTSKLKTAEDLYAINSLGFRGEALASISNVAKVEVMTKTEGALAGFQVMVEEGEIIYKDIVGSPKGTTMIVRDLFYNLPVRKDFLKSDLAESNSISDVVYKAALGNPQCSFRYIKDGKNIITTSKNSNYKNHIYSILGRDFSENLNYVKFKNELLNIKGYISNNELYRGNRSHQYLYINGRHIKNKDISETIERRYQSIVPKNRFPVFIIFMEIDPDKVDVNIHPTKQEVKFSNMDMVLNSIEKMIVEGLKTKINIPKIKTRKEKKSKVEKLPLLFDMVPEEKTETLEPKLNNPNNEDTKKSIIVKDLTKGQLEGNFEDRIYEESPNTDDFPEKNLKLEDKMDDIQIEETLKNLNPIGVIFKTYILAEDRINESFYIIDQHAAHERIHYEKFLKEYKNEKVAVQQLLTPEILEMTSMEISKLEENISLFRDLGFDIDVFGPNSVIIRGVPLLFGDVDIKNLFWEILDNLDKDISSPYDVRIDKIMKISCVNSIKSGDSMDEKEIMALFNQLKKCEFPWTCPHGRPTMIEMSKKDIEKEFLRIM